MTDPLTILAGMRRPGLLVRAAHLGQIDYSRNRSLRRLFPDRAPPPPGHAFHDLVEREALLEQARVEESTTYSFMRHIELLIALVAEARLAARRETA